MRWLFLIHRYLGIGIGVLMLLWCLSGFVMMYVRYPELSSSERLHHLQPLDWGACCVVNDELLADDLRLEHFQVERVGGSAMLSVKPVGGRASLIDLSDGHAVTALTDRDAQAVAASFSRAAGNLVRPRLERLVDRDQWTISGEFNAQRPLFLFALGDTDASQLYVASTTGKAVQLTTAHERFWNWLGAIPHWLYFTQLRRDVAAWSQVVISTSLAGCFLTIIGLYIGVHQFVRRPRERLSPYRGIALWHHVGGLVFGIFLLAWVLSGLVSMNPWGFLDSEGPGRAVALLRGAPLSGAQAKAAIRSLPLLAKLPDIVAVESAPLWGRLYLTVTTRGGARWRFDSTGRSARINSTTWGQISQALGGTPDGPEMLTAGDAYYFDRHGDHILLPAYRIISSDPQHSRYYFDPLTGALLASFGSNARWYRWLHQGLHTLDLTPAFRSRPAWDVLMLLLLSGATVISFTGTYVGLRRMLPR